MTMTLKKGNHYDVGVLSFRGWTDGDGTPTDGYYFGYYFDAGGEYLGPDSHGIEPIFEETEYK